MHIFWKQIKLKWKLSEPFYMQRTNPTEAGLGSLAPSVISEFLKLDIERSTSQPVIKPIGYPSNE
jgi:hypothetical protein